MKPADPCRCQEEWGGRRTEEEEVESEATDQSFSGFRPSDLGDVSVGDSLPGLGGSSSRS